MLREIKPLIFKKIWGHEKWIYSSYPGKETFFENGDKVMKGPLIKIIKTNKPLSIQVHPDDEFAQKLENQKIGKAESWYILDCDDKSKLILGMKNYDSKWIRNNVKSECFLENLNTIKPKIGNFYNIPAGFVHGLGANITVLEVQQSSDITYRYFDYNRLKNGKHRELHIEKAIIVQKSLTHTLEPTSTNPLTYKTKYATQQFGSGKSLIKKNSLLIDLVTHKTYWVEKCCTIDLNKFVIIQW